MKSWSNLQNFSTYRKSGTDKSNLKSNFTPEVVLWPFLRMRTKKWPKWLKTWPKLRLCTNPGAENLILYNINARRTTVVVSAHT